MPTPWAYVNSVLHISQKNEGLQPDSEWELLPKHFNNRTGYGLAFDFFFFNKEKEKKKNFLLSGKRELRDKS